MCRSSRRIERMTLRRSSPSPRKCRRDDDTDCRFAGGKSKDIYFLRASGHLRDTSGAAKSTISVHPSAHRSFPESRIASSNKSHSRYFAVFSLAHATCSATVWLGPGSFLFLATLRSLLRLLRHPSRVRSDLRPHVCCDAVERKLLRLGLRGDAVHHAARHLGQYRPGHRGHQPLEVLLEVAVHVPTNLRLAAARRVHHVGFRLRASELCGFVLRRLHPVERDAERLAVLDHGRHAVLLVARKALLQPRERFGGVDWANCDGHDSAPARTSASLCGTRA